ncbi:hypothetical protein RRG08_062634 [Elysia crispata]|uniref:Uncharacterized protein n=1 Tax=Elysia crispata TaxID=231223 RepID=A0AAE0YYP8_9GAST|nr:hypothetical protein RRG08_062634 [Elysia crispata]
MRSRVVGPGQRGRLRKVRVRVVNDPHFSWADFYFLYISREVVSDPQCQVCSRYGPGGFKIDTNYKNQQINPNLAPRASCGYLADCESRSSGSGDRAGDGRDLDHNCSMLKSLNNESALAYMQNFMRSCNRLKFGTLR